MPAVKITDILPCFSIQITEVGHQNFINICFMSLTSEDGEQEGITTFKHMENNFELHRSSWLNCALRDDEAVYWVGIGHYEAVAVSN